MLRIDETMIIDAGNDRVCLASLTVRPPEDKGPPLKGKIRAVRLDINRVMFESDLAVLAEHYWKTSTILPDELKALDEIETPELRALFATNYPGIGINVIVPEMARLAIWVDTPCTVGAHIWRSREVR